MVARHHQHESVAAIGKGFQGPRIDGAGNDAEIGHPFGNQADDLVAQTLFQIDADIRMRGQKGTQRFRQELGQCVGVG
jgi:hypothetical protein